MEDLSKLRHPPLPLQALSGRTVTHLNYLLPPHTMPKYDPDRWISQLMQCEHLSEPDMKTLCNRVRTLLMEESNIQPVSSPVTICGDIHGQFWDLLELLRKGGPVPDTNYIFMARLSLRYLCSLSVLRAAGNRAILWIGVTTAWKRCRCCWHSKHGEHFSRVRART